MMMKITRDYILGLGSGLVISALLMFAMQMSGIGLAPKSESSQTAGQTASVQEQNILETNSDANSVSDSGAGTGSDAGTSQASEQSSQVQDSADQNNLTTNNTVQSKDAQAQSIRFTISYGSDAETIAGQLEKKGLISDKQEFLETLNKRNAAGKLQTGTFTLPLGLSVNDLISILIQKPD
jgi:hypothetical protein